MNTTDVAHMLVDSFVFQKAMAHQDYDALAREIALALAAVEAGAYERAAWVASWHTSTLASPDHNACARAICDAIRALATGSPPRSTE